MRRRASAERRRDQQPERDTIRAPSAAPPALEMIGVTKHFGSVAACDDVTLTVGRGEIRGLLGQNGAGKSTLMKILIGLVTAEHCEIRLGGKQVKITEPGDAASLGIGMVHQHFSLIGPLTVWENVQLGGRGRVDAKAAVREVKEVGERYGLPVDPYAPVERLTTGQRQRVELIKALRSDPRLLILDEPTSVLSIAETRELFDVLRRLVAGEGRTVVLISHKLDEVLHATDSITIMREGAIVTTLSTSEADVRMLAREMVGRPVSLRSATTIGLIDPPIADRAREAADKGPEAANVDAREGEVGSGAVPDVKTVLRIRGARAIGPDGRLLLDGLSLDVSRGEILGIAGIEGNGQAALARLLSSLLELAEGTIEVNGRPVKTGRAGVMRHAGVGVIPEDRHASGCILEMSVAENLVIGDLAAAMGRWLIDPRKLHDHAQRLIRAFTISTPSPHAPMWSLSGGNQQRVLLARELSRSPAVLVAAQPTRGLDVGAIEYITKRLREVAASGVGVLLISTELEEILALADRIAVLYRGRIVGEMPRAELDIERLGLMMGGQAA